MEISDADAIVHTSIIQYNLDTLQLCIKLFQAKRQAGQMYYSFYEESGCVSKAATEMQKSPCNTLVRNSFLVGHMSSWQVHLKRISYSWMWCVVETYNPRVRVP